jgi:hypothetical protein
VLTGIDLSGRKRSDWCCLREEDEEDEFCYYSPYPLLCSFGHYIRSLQQNPIYHADCVKALEEIESELREKLSGKGEIHILAFSDVLHSIMGVEIVKMVENITGESPKFFEYGRMQKQKEETEILIMDDILVSGKRVSMLKKAANDRSIGRVSVVAILALRRFEEHHLIDKQRRNIEGADVLSPSAQRLEYIVRECDLCINNVKPKMTIDTENRTLHYIIEKNKEIQQDMDYRIAQYSASFIMH